MRNKTPEEKIEELALIYQKLTHKFGNISDYEKLIDSLYYNSLHLYEDTEFILDILGMIIFKREITNSYRKLADKFNDSSNNTPSRP